MWDEIEVVVEIIKKIRKMKNDKDIIISINLHEKRNFRIR